MTTDKNLKLDKIDYSDLYFASFRSDKNYSKEDFLKGFFTIIPGWAKRQMKMEPLAENSIEKGGKYYFFDVMDVNDVEITLGGSEKTLDYRFSVAFLNSMDDKYIAVVSTKVKFNSFLGKLSFGIIKPFHKYLVKRVFDNTINAFKGNS